MLGMSNEQWLTLLRQALPVIGGIAITFGWLTKDQVSDLSVAILSAAGPAVVLGSAVWAVYMKRKAGIIKSAADLPEVKKITLDPAKAETKALNEATPNNVQVGVTQGEVK